MVDTTSGLIPINTGFNLEVLLSLNACIGTVSPGPTLYAYTKCGSI